MRLEPTRIDGVDLIHWDLLSDDRGWFARTYCTDVMAAAGRPFNVVQANMSSNRHQHTLRGIHFQCEPHGEPKIISCRSGRIFDVAVDLREGSSTYLQWIGVELGEEIPLAMLLPIGVGHGFLTLTPDSEVTYLMGAPYVAEAARGVRWDDPTLAIDWPAQPFVISERDARFPLIEPQK